MGFTNSQFDEMRILPSGSAGLAVDTLQFNRRVPEPATLALLGLGLADIGYQRKRRFAA
jgi:hypothetical protein